MKYIIAGPVPNPERKIYIHVANFSWPKKVANLQNSKILKFLLAKKLNIWSHTVEFSRKYEHAMF